MTRTGRAGKRLRGVRRGRWGVLLVALASGLSLDHSAPAGEGPGAAPPAPAEEAVYESRAILELVAGRPGGQAADAEAEVPTIGVRMLGWMPLREIILGGKVDLGVKIDPDDPRQVEALVHQMREHTWIRAIGARHIEVVHRGPAPERNAALVNELVKRFIGEARRERQQRAKTDLEHLRRRVDAAQARLERIEARLVEFAADQPWLTDDLAGLHARYEDAQQRADGARLERDELQAQPEPDPRALNRLTAFVRLEADRAATLRDRVEQAPKLLAHKRRLHRLLRYAEGVAERLNETFFEAEERLQETMAEAYGSRYRVLEYARPERIPAAVVVEEETLEPIEVELVEPPVEVGFEVESLVKGDILFAQLDRNGLVTAIAHFFREVSLDQGKPFTIPQTARGRGAVELYRLRNLGTGESYDFRDILVERGEHGTWTIADKGWQQIRDELQKRLRVKLARIGLKP